MGSKEAKMSGTDEIREMLTQMVTDTGVRLRGSAAGLIEFAAARAERLSRYLGEPDYDEMVTAARDVVLLEVGIRATYEADAATQRLMEIVYGGLRLLAAAVAGQ